MLYPFVFTKNSKASFLSTFMGTLHILPQWGELEGERFCIAPHLAPHFKLGRALQSWEKVTCVAPSPFGEEHWKTKSIKSSFVLDYCFTLRSRSFHLLTQINIHFASRYFGVSSLRSVSSLSRNVTFSHLSFGRVQNPLRPVWISKLPTSKCNSELLYYSYKLVVKTSKLIDLPPKSRNKRRFFGLCPQNDDKITSDQNGQKNTAGQ